MATLNQIDANRLNSQRLRGPVTPEDTSKSPRLKTAINAQSQVIPGEDPAELETLAAEYHNQFRPATALARFLVDALVSADWQLRRLRRVEAELWTHQISTKENFGSLNQKAPLGNVFDYSRDAFTRLQRRIDSTERCYYRALNQLRRPIHPATECPPLASSDAPAPEPDQLAPVPAPAAELASFCTMPDCDPADPGPLPPGLCPPGPSFDTPFRARYPAVNLRCSA